MMASVIVAFLLDVLVAWWREGIGGIVLVIVAVAYSIFALISYSHSSGLAVLTPGGSWFLVGGLFPITWRRMKYSY